MKLILRTGTILVFILLFGSSSLVSQAQSIDINAPSPVRTNEITGTIVARDLGDSRLTDHFYSFTGTPGDVLITVKSNNLNGDVDLFTAGSLRPLMKFTLYAESSLPVTRSVFLRKREALVLRVEARTPNDDEGVYNISLGGSFEPTAGVDPVAETPDSTSDATPTMASRRQGTRRVTSVGARVPEPPEVREEVATAPTPEPTPDDSPTPSATPDPTVATEAPTPSPAPRRTRGRTPSSRRRPAAPPVKTEEPSASETPVEDKTSEVSKADTPAPTRRTGRRGATDRQPEQIPEPEPQTGPRLVIEMLDGSRVERYMSTIRRVTVENNQIVVVRKDGSIERTRMREVLRMAIEP